MRLDLSAFAVNGLFILLYYLYLGWRTRRSPHTSVHALNAKIRERWLASVMNKNDSQIVAVQTLRNSVMAANFMASTSILLMIGVLNLSEKIGEWSLHWLPFGMVADMPEALWRIKLCLLLLDYFIAFYCFSMAIRFYNHVGYMINLGNDGIFSTDMTQLACRYLNRAGSFYSFGTRTFFFSLPIILWFFGPLLLTAGTLCLIAGLTMLDKTPA